jgi:uncharacterized protein (DUF2249 family)
MIAARPDQSRPVSASDRVSDVLARDESLVEIFVRQAPHFAKLRSRSMRKVMGGLVTVEQAARTANVSVEGLVRELNAALGATPGPQRTAAPAQSTINDGEAVVHPASANVIEIDVREDLRAGREPFSRIMSAIGSLDAGDILHLRAIFEPVPLVTVLGKRGFAHESRAHAVDDWSVWFWRPDRCGAVSPEASAVPAFENDVPADDACTTYLDVRRSNPPEPMMRTLRALEELPTGRTLVQINDRVPQFLFPVLAERGFAWEIDDARADRVLVRIRHAE